MKPRWSRGGETLWIVTAFLLGLGVHASPALPRSAPEGQGIESPALLAFVEEADEKLDSLHGFVLLRHGKVVAEGWWAPYTADARHELYSLSKSFTSTAIGFAVSEGKLSVDDPVISFFPDELPDQPGANLKAMRIRDLLSMSAGHEKESPGGRELMTAKGFLAHPVPFKPGTHFLYNTPATFMLSAIMQKVTGETVLDYLKPRLFEPLGIENPTWEKNVQGISLGGYGLSVRTEDIARFGQLYLQRGRWNDKQILPASWIDAATARQTSNGSNPKSDWDQGYGYQFWRSRHGTYRGDGAFGQYCMVMPEQDAVLAITAGVRDMQAVMNLVWDKLLPAMKSGPLTENPAAQARLKSKLAGLKLRTPAGAETSPIATRIAGITFSFPENEQNISGIALEPSNLVINSKGILQKIPYGNGEWRKSVATIGNFPERPIAAAGAWTSDNTFTTRICFTETPFVMTWKLRFDGDEAILDREFNVFFGATKLPQLIGTAK